MKSDKEALEKKITEVTAGKACVTVLEEAEYVEEDTGV